MMSNKTDNVEVADPALIYADVADRNQFDLIAISCIDEGERFGQHVLKKFICHEDKTVVFRHWIKRRERIGDIGGYGHGEAK